MPLSVLAVAAVAATADVTKFNNEQEAAASLANTVATSDELEAALGAIDQASQDFLVPIGEATQQFTKLNAAARASGFTVEEVEEVYRGLAAANTALGGDSESCKAFCLLPSRSSRKARSRPRNLEARSVNVCRAPLPCLPRRSVRHRPSWIRRWRKAKSRLEDFVTFARSLLESTKTTPRNLRMLRKTPQPA